VRMSARVMVFPGFLSGGEALTCIPDPNRSTAVNFVDVDGRSLYIVDCRMVVVEGGECHTPCKKEGELSGRGKYLGNMSGGKYVWGKCPDRIAYVIHWLCFAVHRWSVKRLSPNH